MVRDICVLSCSVKCRKFSALKLTAARKSNFAELSRAREMPRSIASQAMEPRLDVANGLQPGQFAVGERTTIRSLSELDPIYKALLDRPITVTLGLIGPDGRVGLTPMWFDYEGDKILVNTASHRAKCEWIRQRPQLTLLSQRVRTPMHTKSERVTHDESIAWKGCGRDRRQRGYR